MNPYSLSYNGVAVPFALMGCGKPDGDIAATVALFL